ncbi:MAG: hypothetical protein JNM88_05080 [Chitinophagaceae bacterium]|nr:hypothetical protein [Chitinophagaceae bacterium]
MRTFLLLSLFIAASFTLPAQQFGGHPSAQKWKQINTDTARVIFQPGLDSQASRVATIVHYLASQQPVSLGNKLKKINIVLQNHTTVANGYVGLGPFRSEFFMTPPMNNFGEGSIGWTDQLAIHEYRHVQQFNNFNNGLSHVAKVLFGEEGFAVAINASVPNWFYEGDAVHNETVLTNQGRGRLPQFLNAYPSLWQAGKKYSWMKLRNGSLKDYVPNHYNLGYLLVNYGREKYGPDFWTKVTKDASAFKGLFYPFQSAVKRHTGVDYKTFVSDAFEQYRTKTERVSYTRDEFVFPVNKNYVTNYFFPYAAGTDSLIYLKSSYRQRPAFYIKDKDGEHKLRIMDISGDEQFSYRNGKIVYAAFERDARWRWHDYSVIKVLDVATGLQQTLTQKSKYFTPDISADGSKVAAVQVNSSGQSELHILDAANGQKLQTIRSAEIGLFTDPKFIDADNLVTAVRLRDGKMALALAEISTGNTMRLTPPSFSVVGYPCVNNGIIYFTASYGGNDDVFALRMSDKKIYRISNGGLGKYFVNAGGGKLTWSVFTAEGYQLKQTEEKDVQWTEVSAATTEILKEKFSVSPGKDNGDVLLGKMPARTFTVSDYKKGTRLLNFHSWRPYYEDPILTYSLYGQNILNTMETEIFYAYNQNEKTSSAGINAVYGGWFPYLNLGTELTFDRQSVSGNRLRTWNQLDSRIGLSVPLSTVKGRTFRNFNISSFYVLRNDMYKGPFKDSLGTVSFSYLQHSVSWSQQVQQAAQHIYPRLAYSLSGSFRHAITRYEGRQFIGNGAIYLPGFVANHNLVLTGSFQEIDTLGQLTFGNRFAYSRGYTGRYFTRMWRMSANYHLPLLHTDWGFANLLYIQRVRANLFYDFTKVYSRNKTQTRDQRSVGAEVYFDTKWWNQYELTFGFRISRLLDRDQFDGFQGNIFEFIMSVSIFPK